jgi:hypothetical protein
MWLTNNYSRVAVKKKRKKKWVQKVKTVSTFPPPGTFTAARPPEEIARIMADPKVSPIGWGSGIKMVNYFKNRGGKRLTKEHKAHLDEAIALMKQWKDEGRDQQEFKGEGKRLTDS